jgi:dihydrofolate reductase
LSAAHSSVTDAPDGRPRLSLIVAMARNRVIGRDGKLPWHLSADLKRFKALTMGHHIVMGRKTWESIGRPLPGRTSVVITRNPAYAAAGATVVNSVESALKTAAGDSEVFVIGGADIYRSALALADRIYLTELQAEYQGDVLFPPLAAGEWLSGQREHHAAEADQPAWDFVIYERAAKTS